VNSDGTELWFCAGNTSTPNPDCPTIGNPQVTFPTGGIVLGLPQYTWSLSACDGGTNGSSLGGTPTYIPCGQMGAFYEDDSGDNADELALMWPTARLS
jgi:GH18 family chitinase